MSPVHNTAQLLRFLGEIFLFAPTESGMHRLYKSTMDEFGVDTTKEIMVMGDYFLVSINKKFYHCNYPINAYDIPITFANKKSG